MTATKFDSYNIAWFTLLYIMYRHSVKLIVTFFIFTKEEVLNFAPTFNTLYCSKLYICIYRIKIYRSVGDIVDLKQKSIRNFCQIIKISILFSWNLFHKHNVFRVWYSFTECVCGVHTLKTFINDDTILLCVCVRTVSSIC